MVFLNILVVHLSFSDISILNVYWVTCRVSYKMQELLTLREHLDSTPVAGWVRVAHLFTFPAVLCFCVLFDFALCLVCTQCYQCLWIVHTWFCLRFSLTFLSRGMNSLLPTNSKWEDLKSFKLFKYYLVYFTSFSDFTFLPVVYSILSSVYFLFIIFPNLFLFSLCLKLK